MASRQARDSRGRFASGGGGSSKASIRGQAQAASRRKDPGSQLARGAARARQNSDRAAGTMKMARAISTSGKANAALKAYNAKQGPKAARTRRTAEKARKYYRSKGA